MARALGKPPPACWSPGQEWVSVQGWGSTGALEFGRRAGWRSPCGTWVLAHGVLGLHHLAWHWHRALTAFREWQSPCGPSHPTGCPRSNASSPLTGW